MKITVNEQLQQFYLATDIWRKAVGHEIKVGKYRFCSIPTKTGINVSEVSSGARLLEIPYSDNIIQLAEDKDGAIELFYEIGESIERIIGEQINFDAAIKGLKKIAFDKLGEMPEIKNVEVGQWT